MHRTVGHRCNNRWGKNKKMLNAFFILKIKKTFVNVIKTLPSFLLALDVGPIDYITDIN